MRASDLREFFGFINDTRLTAAAFLQRYVDYHGMLNFGSIRVVRRTLKARLLSEFGARDIDENALVGHDGKANIAYLRTLLPETADPYFTEEELRDFSLETLLPESTNEWQSTTLPAPFNMRLKSLLRPAWQLASARGRSLFIGPYGFQYFCRRSGRAWRIARSRAFPAATATRYKSETIEAPVVVIQDQFNDSNFAHFLYDCVPRIMHFAASRPHLASTALFLMGGEPTPYHALILDEVARACAIPPQNFRFLAERVVLDLTNEIYVFSDSGLTIMHPLVMCHKAVLHPVRALLAHWPDPPRTARRLYVSRRDAKMRCIRNEDTLSKRLAAIGFETVVMSDLDARAQIERLMSAEHIVAPHGMGLTNLLFNRAQARVTEIFSPELGGDDYAFVARALGLQYDHHVGFAGEPGRHLEFDVDVDCLMAQLRGTLREIDRGAGAAVDTGGQACENGGVAMQQPGGVPQ